MLFAGRTSAKKMSLYLTVSLITLSSCGHVSETPDKMLGRALSHDTRGLNYFRDCTDQDLQVVEKLFAYERRADFAIMASILAGRKESFQDPSSFRRIMSIVASSDQIDSNVTRFLASLDGPEYYSTIASQIKQGKGSELMNLQLMQLMMFHHKEVNVSQSADRAMAIDLLLDVMQGNESVEVKSFSVTTVSIFGEETVDALNRQRANKRLLLSGGLRVLKLTPRDSSLELLQLILIESEDESVRQEAKAAFDYVSGKITAR